MKRNYSAFMDILLSENSNRIFADIIMAIIILITLIYMIFDGSDFNSENLKNLSGFAMTVILSITALGISVLQTDDIKNKINVENKRQYLIKYVFSTIKDIVIFFLGFILSIIAKNYAFVIKIYTFLIVVFLVLSIRNTIFLFMSYFEIKKPKDIY